MMQHHRNDVQADATPFEDKARRHAEPLCEQLFADAYEIGGKCEPQMPFKTRLQPADLLQLGRCTQGIENVHRIEAELLNAARWSAADDVRLGKSGCASILRRSTSKRKSVNETKFDLTPKSMRI